MSSNSLSDSSMGRSRQGEWTRSLKPLIYGSPRVVRPRQRQGFGPLRRTRGLPHSHRPTACGTRRRALGGSVPHHTGRAHESSLIEVWAKEKSARARPLCGRRSCALTRRVRNLERLVPQPLHIPPEKETGAGGDESTVGLGKHISPCTYRMPTKNSSSSFSGLVSSYLACQAP